MGELTLGRLIETKEQNIARIQREQEEDRDTRLNEDIMRMRAELTELQEQARNLGRSLAQLRAQQKISESELLKHKEAQEKEELPSSFASIHREKVSMDSRLVAEKRALDQTINSLNSQAVQIVAHQNRIDYLGVEAQSHMDTIDEASHQQASAALNVINGMTSELPGPLEYPPRDHVRRGRIALNRETVLENRQSVIDRTESTISECIDEICLLASKRGAVVRGVGEQFSQRDVALQQTDVVPLPLFQLLEMEVLRLNGRLSAVVEELGDKTDEVNRMSVYLADMEKDVSEAERRVKRAVSRSSAAQMQRAQEMRDMKTGFLSTKSTLVQRLHESRIQLSSTRTSDMRRVRAQRERNSVYQLPPPSQPRAYAGTEFGPDVSVISSARNREF